MTFEQSLNSKYILTTYMYNCTYVSRVTHKLLIFFIGYTNGHLINKNTKAGDIYRSFYLTTCNSKVEKVIKGSLVSIPSPSPSVKIQIMGGKVYLRCEGKKTLLGVFNKLLKTKRLLTSASNVLPYYLK